METYTLSLYDLHLINVMRYIRANAPVQTYIKYSRQICDLMTTDAFVAYIALTYETK